MEESEESNMKLGDIYKNKENNSIIQIDSFATPMGKFCEKPIIVVFRQIEKHNEFEFGSCPSFNGYGSREEIEAEYAKLAEQYKTPVDQLKKYMSPEAIKEDMQKTKAVELIKETAVKLDPKPEEAAEEKTEADAE